MVELTAMLHRSAARLVDRLRGEVAQAQAAEARMVTEAWREHAMLPPNYWHGRHQAEQRLRCAERFEAALQEGRT